MEDLRSELFTDIMKKKYEELEKRIEELEMKILKLQYPNYPKFGGRDFELDPDCLHNGCDHKRNPACWLVCPHCSPRC